MKILVTGKGTSGSWVIRGIQLGQTIGASVQADAQSARGYDLTILVKRPGHLLERLRGVPLVWDLVDAWPQPIGNEWDRDLAMQWLRDQIRRIKPVALVAATNRMAQDCVEFGLPVLWLPHHARPHQELNPVRDRIHVVGYEGGEAYLGSWRSILETECRDRGYRFKVNPMTLAELDIVVALRQAAGYPARFWKSGVKLANAQATGTPCILSPEAGYLETQSGAECWAEDDRNLALSLDRLEEYRVRAETSRTLLRAAPCLGDIAQRYRSWLESL